MVGAARGLHMALSRYGPCPCVCVRLHGGSVANGFISSRIEDIQSMLAVEIPLGVCQDPKTTTIVPSDIDVAGNVFLLIEPYAIFWAGPVPKPSDRATTKSRVG